MEDLNLDNLQLIDFNEPLLRTKPKKFDFEKYDAQKICDALFEKQKEFGGIGLSANQVGLDMKVFVMGDGEALKRYIINPELIDCSKETNVAKEGCLSLPGIFLNITRPAEATFKYQDVEGKECIEKYVDLAARVALHEYDHMLGYNYTMRASRLKLERALKAYNKKAKANKRLVEQVTKLPPEVLEMLAQQEQQEHQEQSNG
jgi:peptide deformylase